jgi:hypothetical protein
MEKRESLVGKQRLEVDIKITDYRTLVIGKQRLNWGLRVREKHSFIGNQRPQTRY